MSIIYNALKKTQDSLQAQQNPNPTPKTRLPWIDILMVILIIFLSINAIIFYYPKVKQLFTHPTVVSQAPKIPTVAEYAKLVKLNGVFVSDEEKVALINNQPVHIGDTILGMEVIAIESDKVKLLSKAGVVVLPVELNYADAPRHNRILA